MKLLFFSLTSLLIATVGISQDYIITWKNDTIFCRLPEKPAKEGFRPRGKYDNGHTRFIAVFPNDSVRIIEAGNIKGYYRKKHGKGLLCNGSFESKRLVDEKGRKNNGWQMGDGVEEWFFIRKIEAGIYASLYVFYMPDGSDPPNIYYCVIKHNEPDSLKATVMFNYKRTVEFLSDPGIEEKMKDFQYKKNRNTYINIVREYNRLKAASKNQ